EMLVRSGGAYQSGSARSVSTTIVCQAVAGLSSVTTSPVWQAGAAGTVVVVLDDEVVVPASSPPPPPPTPARRSTPNTSTTRIVRAIARRTRYTCGVSRRWDGWGTMATASVRTAPPTPPV